MRRRFVCWQGVGFWRDCCPRQAPRSSHRCRSSDIWAADTPELFASRLNAFRQGLASTGFVEGKNVVIQYRWAQGRNDRLPELAAELVRANVNVLSTPGSLASTFAAKGATSTIPIVSPNSLGADGTGFRFVS